MAMLTLGRWRVAVVAGVLLSRCFQENGAVGGSAYMYRQRFPPWLRSTLARLGSICMNAGMYVYGVRSACMHRTAKVDNARTCHVAHNTQCALLRLDGSRCIRALTRCSRHGESSNAETPPGWRCRRSGQSDPSGPSCFLRYDYGVLRTKQAGNFPATRSHVVAADPSRLPRVFAALSRRDLCTIWRRLIGPLTIL